MSVPTDICEHTYCSRGDLALMEWQGGAVLTVVNDFGPGWCEVAWGDVVMRMSDEDWILRCAIAAKEALLPTAGQYIGTKFIDFHDARDTLIKFLK